MVKNSGVSSQQKGVDFSFYDTYTCETTLNVFERSTIIGHYRVWDRCTLPDFMFKHHANLYVIWNRHIDHRSGIIL